MIILRGYATVPRGRLSDAIASLREVIAGSEQTVRIYEPLVGDNDVVGFEMEFENLAHYERWRNESVHIPESQAALQGWFELTTAFRNEILRLVE
jgi:hypothetical protein